MGGLVFFSLPVLLIGALIYWLVSRSKPGGVPAPYQPPASPPTAATPFCPHCGRAIDPDARFCVGCGGQIS
jgi:hypothetical protein